MPGALTPWSSKLTRRATTTKQVLPPAGPMLPCPRLARSRPVCSGHVIVTITLRLYSARTSPARFALPRSHSARARFQSPVMLGFVNATGDLTSRGAVGDRRDRPVDSGRLLRLAAIRRKKLRASNRDHQQPSGVTVTRPNSECLAHIMRLLRLAILLCNADLTSH
jgi:hypothetical protein